MALAGLISLVTVLLTVRVSLLEQAQLWHRSIRALTGLDWLRMHPMYLCSDEHKPLSPARKKPWDS